MPPLSRSLTTATRHIRPSLQTHSLVTKASISSRHFSTTPPLPTASASPVLPPLNLPKWLSQNSHRLKPPINNYCVYNDPLTVMIVGGPNARTDYHINTTPEFFYQYRGRMLLKTIQTIDGKEVFKDVYINEGEMFLLPADVPHNPVRFEDTVGIVIEQPRPEGSLDRLRWYCGGCGGMVHEASFHCTDLGTQIKEAVNAFKKDEEKRRCGKCGEVCETAPTKEGMEAMRMGG